MSKYIIHYFSGTGNTYHMVKTIEDELIKKAKEVVLINIEKANVNEIQKDTVLASSKEEIHIFCFPVYGFGAPSLMIQYILNLKKVKDTKAIVFCTSAGIMGQSLSYAKFLLSKKGFHVIYTEMIQYTYNWTQILNPQSKEKENQVFKIAETKTRENIHKIMSSDIKIKRNNMLCLFIYWLIFIVFSTVARKVLGKTFIADQSCDKCGTCVKVCPIKTIQIEKERPRWGLKCESCQRCINMCPKKAIQLSVGKLLIFLTAEFSPIFIIRYVNLRYINSPIILDFIVFLALFAINTILAVYIIWLLEKVTIFRKIFQISYTKNYRRNIASGFRYNEGGK